MPGRLAVRSLHGRRAKRQAKLWSSWLQSTGPPLGSNQLTSGGEPEAVGRPSRKRARRTAGCRLRNAISSLVNRTRSPFFSTRSQSNQEMLVVLAIGVVVALLRAAAFVAEEEHRHALAEQQRRQHVANLPLADLLRRCTLRVGPSTP